MDGSIFIEYCFEASQDLAHPFFYLPLNGLLPRKRLARCCSATCLDPRLDFKYLNRRIFSNAEAGNDVSACRQDTFLAILLGSFHPGDSAAWMSAQPPAKLSSVGGRHILALQADVLAAVVAAS